MADVGQYSFENLTQSGIFRIPSKDDRQVSLGLDTFGGNTGLSIFTGGGGKPWKLNIPRKILSNIIILLRKMQAEPRPCREPLFVHEFFEDGGKKGFRQKGCIGFGISEDLQLYIDVADNDLPNRYMFPIKNDPRFDFSNTSMSEKELLQGSLEWLIHSFTLSTGVAERLTSFKRQGGQGGGRGNFGGGSGGGNRNYNNGGGGGNYNRQNNQQQQQSTTFGGGGPDVENDLHV